MSGSAFGGKLGLSALGGKHYDGERLLAALPAALERWRFGRDKRCATLLACRELAEILDGLDGECLQQRWERFEEHVWQCWVAGVGRPPPHRWSLGPRLLVMSRAVRPGWPVLGAIAPIKWLAPLPESDPLKQAAAELRRALGGVSWSGERMHDGAMVLALRIPTSAT